MDLPPFEPANGFYSSVTFMAKTALAALLLAACGAAHADATLRGEVYRIMRRPCKHERGQSPADRTWAAAL